MEFPINIRMWIILPYCIFTGRYLLLINPKVHDILVKMKKLSLQWTQFMQLRKTAWNKKFRTSTGFELVTLRLLVQCSTNWAMKPDVGSRSIILWVHMFPWKTCSNPVEVLNSFFHKLRSLRWSFLHFHFISAVHIWFISYIINTHFFHGNIWTHNWPAPNISGFIAQLVEHRTGNRVVTGSNLVEVLNFFFQASLRNCIN